MSSQVAAHSSSAAPADRTILAAFDEAKVIVYQAFAPRIADAAMSLGTFDAGFQLDRMTWIKPSFGWMLYRSHYATRTNQERILKIGISHAGFLAMLAAAVPSSYQPQLYATPEDWRIAMRDSEIRYQWDPDRNLRLERLQRRALQIGLAGSVVRRYVSEWIRSIEDVTDLARAIHESLEAHAARLPDVPVEVAYPVCEAIAARLGMLVPSRP